MSDEVKLVTIIDYARHWQIDRKTVYRLINNGILTKYITPDGKPYLVKTDKPEGVKAYGEYRLR